MSQSSEDQRRYVDTPLSLLPTPTFQTGKNDPFTKEASNMTISHNSIIRGYNSIYQQAPRIAETDQVDFIRYCLGWHKFVETHHHYEEVHYFPAIEEVTGVKGVMDGEVEEHAAFRGGLEEFKAYLINVDSETTPFNASRLLSIMDSFAGPLTHHLASEPITLVSLARYSTEDRPIDLVKISQEQGKKQMTPDFMVNGMPAFLLNMEKQEFEGGIWKDYPPLPKPVGEFLSAIVPKEKMKIWRFTSCDESGKRRVLVV